MKRHFFAAVIPLAVASAIAIPSYSPPAVALERPVAAPAAKRFANEGNGLKTAVFAGGCFWGVEAVFSHIKGVKSAVSGYHGGNAATATYEKTNTGVTGHAEAVRVVYDPKVVRYDQLLQIFFSVTADPTLRNRQGPDRGSQYRAALVPLNAEQRKVANAYLKQMATSGKWNSPIVTKVEAYKKFYTAETYHQDFMVKNPRHRYILRWDKPKVAALRSMYPSHFRSTFVRN